MIMTERRKKIMKMKDNTNHNYQGLWLKEERGLWRWRIILIKIINDYDWKKKEDYEDEG